MTGIPSKYAGASRLGADGNAMLALARVSFDALTPTQKRTLMDATATGGGYRVAAPSRATSRALFDLGLLESTDKWSALTGMGIMLREAGVHVRTEAAV